MSVCDILTAIYPIRSPKIGEWQMKALIGKFGLKIGYTLNLLLFFMITGGYAGNTPETTISHIPELSFQPEQRVSLTAQLYDPTGISDARCYFRYEDNAPYLFVAMTLSQEGYACHLPAPAARVTQLEYLFVVVNGVRQVIRTSAIIVPIRQSSAEAPREIIQPLLPLTVASDIQLSSDIDFGFDSRDLPTVSPAGTRGRFGLKVGLYDQPGDPTFIYNYFGGFELDLNTRSIKPVKGYVQFPSLSIPSAAPAPDSSSSLSTIEGYPDIQGDDWAGYFYCTCGGERIRVTATVSQDGGNVSITITSNRDCPGRDKFSGNMAADGDMVLFDRCDGEMWTSHYGPASSTYIPIYDYICKTCTDLNVVKLYRDPPIPVPAAPVLLSPANGEWTSPRETLLQWRAVNYAVVYQVQMGLGCGAGTLYQTQATAYAMKNIEGRTNYYWRVRAQNQLRQWGNWSACKQFITYPWCASCPAVDGLLLQK